VLTRSCGFPVEGHEGEYLIGEKWILVGSLVVSMCSPIVAARAAIWRKAGGNGRLWHAANPREAGSRDTESDPRVLWQRHPTGGSAAGPGALASGWNPRRGSRKTSVAFWRLRPQSVAPGSASRSRGANINRPAGALQGGRLPRRFQIRTSCAVSSPPFWHENGSNPVAEVARLPSPFGDAGRGLVSSTSRDVTDVTLFEKPAISSQ
jgi:hypothetical protein